MPKETRDEENPKTNREDALVWQRSRGFSLDFGNFCWFLSFTLASFFGIVFVWRKKNTFQLLPNIFESLYSTGSNSPPIVFWSLVCKCCGTRGRYTQLNIRIDDTLKRDFTHVICIAKSAHVYPRDAIAPLTRTRVKMAILRGVRERQPISQHHCRRGKIYGISRSSFYDKILHLRCKHRRRHENSRWGGGRE